MRHAIAFVAVLLLLLASTYEARAQNLALGRPVTASGYYNDYIYDFFPPDNLTDGRLNDTGQNTDWSFWLTRNYTQDWFVVDLLDTHQLNRIDLQNTHNRGWNDRGTRGFRLSTSLDNTTYTTLLEGELASVFGTGNDIPIESFSFAPQTARYVRFDVLSAYGSWGCGGLNEIMVYSVPEPCSLLLLGMGAVALLRRRSGLANRL